MSIHRYSDFQGWLHVISVHEGLSISHFSFPPGCKYNQVNSHFHCIREGCQFSFLLKHQMTSHARKHMRRMLGKNFDRVPGQVNHKKYIWDRNTGNLWMHCPSLRVSSAHNHTHSVFRCYHIIPWVAAQPTVHPLQKILYRSRPLPRPWWTRRLMNAWTTLVWAAPAGCPRSPPTLIAAAPVPQWAMKVLMQVRKLKCLILSYLIYLGYIICTAPHK